MSVGLTAAALTAIRTSPAPAARTGWSVTMRTSGPPAFVIVTARMPCPCCLPYSNIQRFPEPPSPSRLRVTLLNRNGDQCRIDDLWIGPPAHTRIQRIERGNLTRCQREIENVDVLADAFRSD